jgi:hypothetical protein
VPGNVDAIIMATISGEYVIPAESREGGDQAPVVVQVFAQSDVGRTREHNEDSFIVVNLSEGEPLRFERLVEQPADASATLFMVADGMGGAAAGEVAWGAPGGGFYSPQPGPRAGKRPPPPPPPGPGKGPPPRKGHREI